MNYHFADDICILIKTAKSFWECVKMDKNRLKKYEIAGVFAVIAATAALHFSYELTGGAMWSIIFGSVNESVWEHIKIFTMPYFVWGIIEFCICRPHFRRFFVCKIAGLYFLGLAIPVFYYIYTFFTGRPIIVVDILSSAVWVVIAFVIPYKLYFCPKTLEIWFSSALFMLILFMAMYFSFTACPPRADLFRDPVTGLYGIIPPYMDVGAFYFAV